MNTPLVVNLFAPPGSGKSTTASGLFYNLKTQGVNAELAGEYAKDLTWSKRFSTLQDQIYVFGKQHHRVHRLKDDVDVVIMDSPILMNLAYAQNYPECFKETVYWAFNQYNNLNFYIRRVKPYNPKGRNQTETESDAKGKEICMLLHDYDVKCTFVDGDSSGLSLITTEVLKKLHKSENSC